MHVPCVVGSDIFRALFCDGSFSIVCKTHRLLLKIKGEGFNFLITDFQNCTFIIVILFFSFSLRFFKNTLILLTFANLLVFLNSIDFQAIQLPSFLIHVCFFPLHSISHQCSAHFSFICFPLQPIHLHALQLPL